MPIITKEQLDQMIEAIKKQGLKKRLGEVFCEDFEIVDYDIKYQLDDKKAVAMILKRYGPFEDPWDAGR